MRKENMISKVEVEATLQNYRQQVKVETAEIQMDKVMESEQSAKVLLDSIIADYGVREFLECTFYALNETDQKKFLTIAFQKVCVEG